MKSTHLHGYHGLTQRADVQGWVIQVRFLGRYRQIRTFTSNAEKAARRHDIALSKLDVFSDVRAVPNFPDDFSAISVARDADPSDDYQKFWTELHGLFNELNTEAEAQGIDPDESAAVRRELIEQRRVEVELATQTERADLKSKILKLVHKLPACRFSKEDGAKLKAKLLDLVTTLEELNK